MKSFKIGFSITCLGLLLSIASCNSNNNEADTSMDSSGMDNTQSQMDADTMATDSMTTDSAARPL